VKITEGKVKREELDAMGEDGVRLGRRCVRDFNGTEFTILTPELADLRDRMQAWAVEIARSAPPEVRLDDMDGYASRICYITERSASFEILFYVRGDK